MKIVLPLAFLSLLLPFCTTAQTGDPATTAPVQLQLEAYNERNIEKFISAYSDTVKVYMYPNSLRYEGVEKMRATYAPMFQSTPDLHCTLVNRIAMGNVVIDHESVVFDKAKPPVQAVAIYKVHHGKITEVTFLYTDK